MLKFLKDLVGSPNRTGTIIYHCHPLVIEHAEDGVIYTGNTDVEFTPDPGNMRFGRLVALRSVDGWQPSLNVADRIDAKVDYYSGLQALGGITFLGADDEGNEFRWHIDAAAQQILIDKERCEVSYPCLPDIDEGGLARLNADPVDLSSGVTWHCEPLVIIDDEGEIAFQGEASIQYVLVESDFQRAYLRANFTTEDGWRPTLHALMAQQSGFMAKDYVHNWNFRGYDEDGAPFTWLMGTNATDELIRREDYAQTNEPE